VVRVYETGFIFNKFYGIKKC